MSNKQGQESHPSYMDGVKVKISERYKPPPRIILPMSYSQRLSLNKQIQDNVEHYDFSLEKTVKETMKEWRTARSLIANERVERLERIKDLRDKEKLEKARREQEEKTEDEAQNDDTVTTETRQALPAEASRNFSTYLSNTNVLIPTLATTSRTDMLKPMPLTNLHSQSYTHRQLDKSPFNISDFEADTSSPFDNVELKTINDMEELALVLKNDDKNLKMHQYPYVPASTGSYPYSTYNTQEVITNQYSYPSQLPTTSTTSYIQPTNSNPANGYYYSSNTFQQSTYASPFAYSNKKPEFSSFDKASPQSSTDDNKLPYRSVPDIMRALQMELNNVHVDNSKYDQIKHSINISNRLSSTSTSQQKNAESSKSKSKHLNSELADPFKTLPKDLQQLSESISGMGFPLSRVARACKLLGDDHKKVVEHLLAMSELLDLGFSESQVSTALLKCDNDRDKALDMLIL